MKYIKKNNEFLNEGIVIDGLEYPIPEKQYEYIKDSKTRFPYVNNSENFFDKKNIRVYNPYTKEHYYLEWKYAEIGDENLVFVTFPRTDAPVGSWSSNKTQYVNIRTWNRPDYVGEFIRYKIESYNSDQSMCKVSDGYNSGTYGWFSPDAFYKINKISKGS